MKSYAEIEVFTPESLKALRATEIVVAEFPDSGCFEGTGEWIRCHELARIVEEVLAPYFRLTVVDGEYGIPGLIGYEHSWLIFEDSKNPRNRRFILDPYTIARAPQVQLIDLEAGNSKLYREGKVRGDIKVDWVRREAERVRETARAACLSP